MGSITGALKCARLAMRKNSRILCLLKQHSAALASALVFSALTGRAVDFDLPRTAVVTNRAPLLATPFSALPLGSVRPQGWLRRECALQRDGLTGHAEELYPADLGTNSGWLGGTGESWERGPYYFKGLLALAYTLDDAVLKERAQKWVDWLLDHQHPDGFIGPKSNDDWWPRMVATYALKDYYEATADPRVLGVLSNYFRYMLAQLPSRPLLDWGKARAGDEMDVALWLYNRNGDTNLIAIVDLLRRQSDDWVGIFTSNRFDSYGADFHPKHNVNVEQALKYPAIYYQVSKNSSDKDALALGLDYLTREHALPCGINSGTEFLAGNATIQGVELCAIVEAMLSLETAIRVTGDAALGDRLETIAFNALPAGLANRIMAHQYYTIPNNVIAIYGHHGFNQDYETGILPGPNSGYACCRYNFHMGWPKLAQNSWAATDDGGLAVLVYVPTVVTAVVGGGPIRIREDTRYPFEEQVRLALSISKPAEFPLKLRIPAWCTRASVTVNGEKLSGAKPGSFQRLFRTWHDGDVVTIDLPMAVQTLAGPERSVGIQRGPLVYSLKIGADWSVRTPDPLKLGFDEFEVRPTAPWNYALQLDPADAGGQLVFTNFGRTDEPFDSTNQSVGLLARARRVPDWKVGWRGTHAFEPPLSPVASVQPLEDVTLVPFGSEHLRVSWFPVLGDPRPTTGSFTEGFDLNWSRRWTVFGGNWLAQDGDLMTVPGSANGAKAIAMVTFFTNFSYEADVSVGPAGDAGLIFRVNWPDIGADAYRGYYAGISAQQGGLVFGCASNAWFPLKNVPFRFDANRKYHLKVEAAGSHFSIFLNDAIKPALEADDPRFGAGMIGVRDYCTDSDRSLSSFSNLKVVERTTQHVGP